MPARQRYQAIDTPVGVIAGRDAIIHETVEHTLQPRSLVVRGSVDPKLCSRPDGRSEDLQLIIAFTDVLAVHIEELDFADWAPFEESVVVEVIDSPRLPAIRLLDSAAKLTGDHRHFMVQTYDDVIDVIATALRLSVQPRG